MPEAAGNVALVTKTLVHNGAAAAAGEGRLTLGLFLDFCSLCEAATLLDELRAVESADTLPQFPLTVALASDSVLSEFRPTVSRAELQRLVLRLPEELSRRLLPAWEHDPQSSIDLRDNALLGSTGEVLGIDYRQDLDRLLAQLDEMVRYPSLEEHGPDPSERVLRSNGYLVIAAVNGMDYFPDFDRAPFAAAMIKNLYQSLPRKVYERVAEALNANAVGGKDQLIYEWTLNATMPIPPVAALVLHRSSTLNDIPGRLLEVRQEFARYREHFREFRAKLQAADTLKERRRLQRQYHGLLAAASGPDHEVISVSEALNFAEKLVPVAMAPTMPTSYSAALVVQPAQWLRRWWQRRPLAVLFRLDSKLPRIDEYARLIARLWGEQVGSDMLDQYAAHSARMQRLMSAPAT